MHSSGSLLNSQSEGTYVKRQKGRNAYKVILSNALQTKRDCRTEEKAQKMRKDNGQPDWLAGCPPLNERVKNYKIAIN